MSEERELQEDNDFTRKMLDEAMRNCYLKGRRLLGRDRYCLSCLASFDCEKFNYQKAMGKIK